jgi:hypothetical protein
MSNVTPAVIPLLAKELKDNWVANLTLSGRIAFLENEKKREQILAQAEEMGYRSEVYALASEMFHGKVGA